MHRLGIPQDRIAKRLGQVRETIRDHLAKMPELANPPNADLSKGFTVAQVAEKHNWTEPMAWSLALEGKEDLERFKANGRITFLDADWPPARPYEPEARASPRRKRGLEMVYDCPKTPLL
ncbi:MAG: hypothetical protein ISS63_05770 [Desulfobacteraceae bacterium]|nr:hypothetical protein [Desulfobacteraceae bacterium]